MEMNLEQREKGENKIKNLETKAVAISKPSVPSVVLSAGLVT